MKKLLPNTREEFAKEIFLQIDEPLQKLGFDKFRTAFWQNPRVKNEGGWRLTDLGFNILNGQDYKNYPITLPRDMTITSQTLIYMDHYLDGPWYLKDGVLYCFLEKTAFQLILFSGDVTKYGWSREQSGQKL